LSYGRITTPAKIGPATNATTRREVGLNRFGDLHHPARFRQIERARCKERSFLGYHLALARVRCTEYGTRILRLGYLLRTLTPDECVKHLGCDLVTALRNIERPAVAPL